MPCATLDHDQLISAAKNKHVELDVKRCIGTGRLYVTPSQSSVTIEAAQSARNPYLEPTDAFAG